MNKPSSSKPVAGGLESEAAPIRPAVLDWLSDRDLFEWDDFVRSHPEGMAYYLSGWRAFLEEVCPHLKGGWLVLRDADSGGIRAGLPVYQATSLMLQNRLISSPFATLGGPLVTSEADLAHLLRDLPEALAKHACRRLEIRGLRPSLVRSERIPASETPFLHHYVDLPGNSVELRSRISKGVRRCIQKAGKEGVEIHTGVSEEVLAALATMHARTRRRLGLPVYPKGFFSALTRHLPDSAVTVHSAVRQGEILGVLLSLDLGDWVIAEHIGSTEGGKALGVNHALFWKDLERAIGSGYRHYSFGRTAHDNAGLIQFKRAWGSKEETLSNLVFPPVPYPGDKAVTIRSGPGIVHRLTRWGFRTLPEPLARLAGGIFYKHWA